MKVKHIIVVFALGSALAVLGSLFKILHFPGAANLLIVGMGLNSLSWFLAIWKLVTTKDLKGFLNK